MQVEAGPLLHRVPDGVRAPFPVLPAVTYVYLALLVGIVPTSLAAAVFFGASRSARGVLGSLALGFVGFFVPLVVAVVFGMLFESESVIGFAVLVMRIVAVLLGYGIYRLAKPVVRGHQLLDGGLIPLIYVIGPAFLLLFLTPFEVSFALEMPILMLLQGLVG